MPCLKQDKGNGETLQSYVLIPVPAHVNRRNPPVRKDTSHALDMQLEVICRLGAAATENPKCPDRGSAFASTHIYPPRPSSWVQAS